MSQIGTWGRIAALAACGTGLGSAPLAAQPAPMMVDVSPCVGVSVALERLACYDALGRNGLQSAAARVETNTDGEAELIDQIVDLQERVPGRFLITLASGQVWYQANSQRLRLRKGMQVRIYPSPLGGSWRMARADGEQSGFIQVSRVE